MPKPLLEFVLGVAQFQLIYNERTENKERYSPPLPQVRIVLRQEVPVSQCNALNLFEEDRVPINRDGFNFLALFRNEAKIFSDRVRFSSLTDKEKLEILFQFFEEVYHQNNPQLPIVREMIVDSAKKAEATREAKSKAGKASAEARRLKAQAKLEALNTVEQNQQVLNSVEQSEQVLNTVEQNQQQNITEQNITEHNRTEQSVDKSTEIKKTKAKKETAENDKISVDAYWEIYPKIRRNKKQVTKRLWDKLSLNVQKEILEYLPKYISTRDEQFCKNSDNFLRDEEWKKPISAKPQQQQRQFKTARQIDEEEQHRRKAEYDYVDYLIAKGLELPKASALTALVAKTWDFLNGFPPEDPQEVLTAIEAGQPTLKLAWSAAQ